MAWLEGGGLVVTGLVVVFLLCLVGLFARRRWLSQSGGVFDCALRFRVDDSHSGWRTGMARYDGDEFQWYRVFSASVGPSVRFTRRSAKVVSRRQPGADEADELVGHEAVIRLERRQGSRVDHYEVAMSASSATGLMSWLEAAPPGRPDGA